MDTKHGRKICVVTGTRAEYGLLRPLLRLLADDADIQLQLIVTGTHLSRDYGYTVDLIEADGFLANERIEMLVASDTAVGVTKSLGLACLGFADALFRLQPDLMVLLGDRYEVLAAAQSALIARIPVAHLHGGEVTEGAIDESIRHAVTKMSSLHFGATPKSCERIVQMGENPEAVFLVGATGLDSIEQLPLLSLSELETHLQITIKRPIAVVTVHPETCLAPEKSVEAVESLLAAIADHPDLTIVFTGSNADAGGTRINALLSSYVVTRVGTAPAVFVKSLGQQRYLSLLSHADMVIGNSSSGLVEAHAVKTVAINIGDRQKGREQPPSVLNVTWNSSDISSAILKALSQEQRSRLLFESPYGTPGTANRIFQILRSVSIGNLAHKPFFTIRG
jgi:UDP-N-acetylglucosamine 2-epimerase (non-hydrolysing)/GDP/UDP-N,N'-diacetylbacillosamine 2-epimerase (hydrolysing)